MWHVRSTCHVMRGARGGAHLVVAGRAGGGAGVAGDLGAAGALDDHAAHEVGVVVVLVVDDGEGLRLDTDLRVGGLELDVAGGGGADEEASAAVACFKAQEDTVVKGVCHGVRVGRRRRPCWSGASGPRRSRRPSCRRSASSRTLANLGSLGFVVVSSGRPRRTSEPARSLRPRLSTGPYFLVELALDLCSAPRCQCTPRDGAEASLAKGVPTEARRSRVVAALGEGRIAVHGDVARLRRR